MKVKIAKWGNSLGLRLPKAVTEEVGLKEGEVVDIVSRGRVVEVRPLQARKPFTLKELVAEMKRLGPENEPPLLDWGPDVGEEIIDDDYSPRRPTKENKP